MRTHIISNLRPLFRAFYPFLIAIAVLWAMPRNARAQIFARAELYVTQRSGIVSVYNAFTGTVINSHFIKGLKEPTALALSGNNLFVAPEGGGEPGSSTVGKYNATTGAPISRPDKVTEYFPFRVVSPKSVQELRAGSRSSAQMRSRCTPPVFVMFPR